METKKAYQEKREAQLRELEADIQKLKAKADQTKAEAKIEYQRLLKTLETKQANAEAKLRDLESTSGEAWKDFRTGVDNAVTDLKNAVTDAVSKFG